MRQAFARLIRAKKGLESQRRNITAISAKQTIELLESRKVALTAFLGARRIEIYDHSKIKISGPLRNKNESLQKLALFTEISMQSMSQDDQNAIFEALSQLANNPEKPFLTNSIIASDISDAQENRPNLGFASKIDQIEFGKIGNKVIKDLENSKIREITVEKMSVENIDVLANFVANRKNLAKIDFRIKNSIKEVAQEKWVNFFDNLAKAQEIEEISVIGDEQFISAKLVDSIVDMIKKTKATKLTLSGFQIQSKEDLLKILDAVGESNIVEINLMHCLLRRKIGFLENKDELVKKCLEVATKNTDLEVLACLPITTNPYKVNELAVEKMMEKNMRIRSIAGISGIDITRNVRIDNFIADYAEIVAARIIMTLEKEGFSDYFRTLEDILKIKEIASEITKKILTKNASQQELIDAAQRWIKVGRSAIYKRKICGDHEWRAPFGEKTIAIPEIKGLEMRFLLSKKDLVEEGREMLSCIASYYRKCLTKDGYVMSITLDGKRIATFEFKIDYDNEKILPVELKGFNNGEAPKEAEEAVKRFVENVNNKVIQVDYKALHQEKTCAQREIHEMQQVAKDVLEFDPLGNLGPLVREYKKHLPLAGALKDATKKLALEKIAVKIKGQTISLAKIITNEKEQEKEQRRQFWEERKKPQATPCVTVATSQQNLKRETEGQEV